MIQVDRAHRALIWKELRQLLPLVYMLLGVTLALLILGSIVSSMMPGASVSTAAMLLTMPAFFAAGAGAILIGQEKESQTMQWVTSLPIDSKQIFRTKLLVSVAGLSAMWLIASPCLLLSDVMYSQFSRSLFPDPFLLSLGVWIVHSVYLTLCGIYSSWRCKNVFTGLMLSLALACIPYVLGQLSAETYSLFNFGYVTAAGALLASRSSRCWRHVHRGKSCRQGVHHRFPWPDRRDRARPIATCVISTVRQNRKKSAPSRISFRSRH